jgi:hypothetical protein
MKYFLILILIITNIKLYSAPGDLDLTFDGDGIFTINNFNDNIYLELALSSDNKIVAGGYYITAGNNYFSSVI